MKDLGLFMVYPFLFVLFLFDRVALLFFPHKTGLSFGKWIFNELEMIYSIWRIIIICFILVIFSLIQAIAEQ